MTKLTAVRGSILHFVDDPFYQDLADCIRFIPDGLLVSAQGKILEVGPHAELKDAYSQLDVTHYPAQLILPGLIDTHIHFPQTEIVAAYGEQLLSWLERYNFPTEQKICDRTYALSVAHHFLNELLCHGTTTALVFTTVYPQSTDAFFEAAQSRNLRMIAGKVLMDRHAPAPLLDSPEAAYADSKALIEKWHGQDRLLYAVTPRFAITSTPEQLAVAGQLLQEFPATYLHTHLAGNEAEIAWPAKLFPDCDRYLSVYEQAGLVGERSVFAHGIYLDERDRTTLSRCGCALAHCPTSNLFLGSGLFNLSKAKDPQYPIKVGLGTDIGGGTSFSLLHTGGEAYKIAQLRNQTLNPFQALFLATLGGAQALSLEHQLGNFLPGKEADFIVLDPQATSTLRFRNQSCLSRLQAVDSTSEGINPIAATDLLEALQSLVFSLLILGDDRAVRATYIAGKPAHHRENV